MSSLDKESLKSLIDQQELVLALKADFTPEELAEVQTYVNYAIEGKIDRTAVFLKEMIPNHIEACKQQIASLKRIEENLYKYLEMMLGRVEGKELSGLSYKMRLQRSPGKLIIINEDLIPDKYKKAKIVHTIEINKEQIKIDLALGTSVPGATLVQDDYLRIVVGKASPKRIT